MNNMNLKNVQAAADRLPKQVSFLYKIKQELELMEGSLKENEATYPIYRNINRSRNGIEEEIRVLTQMKACLDNIIMLSKHTESKIADVYHMETILYPQTTFGVSKITGLQHYQNLMPFSLSERGET